MQIRKASFPSTLNRSQGASPKFLGQVPRIVRVTKLEADEAGLLAEKFGLSPYIFGDDWRDLDKIIQDPSVVTFATVTADEKLESISIAAINGIAPCRDQEVQRAFKLGVFGGYHRSIGEKDGILQVVYVDSHAQGQGIGGAHLLAQLHALREHGCPRVWALFNMRGGRAGRDGKLTFWDKHWWEVLHRLGFSEKGAVGCISGSFHAKCVELAQ